MRVRAVAVVAVALLAAGNVNAYRLDRVVTLQSGNGNPIAESDVAALSAERFVAAWSVPGTVSARARVYTSDGEPLTAAVACTEDPGGALQRSPQVATTLGDHIVFGCELQRASGLAEATLRAFDTMLQPIGVRTTFNAGVASFLGSLASVEERTFVVRVYEFLDGLVERNRYHHIDVSGQELGVFRRGITSIVPHGRDRFLRFQYRRDGADPEIALRRQPLSGTGKKLGPGKRIYRVSGLPWVKGRAAFGVGGRTGVLIQAPPADNLIRFSETVRVVLIDGDSAATPHKIDIVLDGFRIIPADVEAWALPMESGFALLWARQPEWDDFPPPLYGVWLQHFSVTGVPSGSPVPLLPGDAKLGQPMLASDGTTYLVPTFRESALGYELEIRRLTDVTACGDVNADGQVDEGDVDGLMASFPDGDPECDPCVCDLDRSGGVDEADAIALENAVAHRIPPECPACASSQ